MDTFLISYCVFISLLLITLLILVVSIRNRNRQIISQMDTKYYFDIIWGPSLEYLFQNPNPYSFGEGLEGFELLPTHEPFISPGYLKFKKVPERRVFSYLIVPSTVHDFYNGDQRLWPTLESESAKNEISQFIAKENKWLKIRASVWKESRGSVSAYFGGGTLFEYGKELALDIIYNPDTRKGTMIIVEK